MAALNFNRYIHVMLFGAGDTFLVKTPMYGRKPDIEVHGILMTSDYAKDFEVRIRNLYTDVNLDIFNKIQVTCGYFGKASLVLDGSISILYTEEPGPDRVTVIKCLLADAESILNSTCDIDLQAGTTLQQVLETITQNMNANESGTVWRDPQIDPSVASLPSNSTLSWNGLVKDLMPDLKARFPKAKIMIAKNQFVAIDPEASIGSGKLVPIKYVQSPPNYTAGRVVLTAPWEPGLQPGDTISIDPQLLKLGAKDYSAYMQKTNKKLWRVISVQFDFSTVNGQNKMIVTGV